MRTYTRMLVAALLTGAGAAHAQDRGDRPWRLDLAVTGNYFSGSFTQLQILGRAFISHSAARAGNDLLISGYRVWVLEEGALLRVGDDTIVSDIPFYYVRPKVYVHGIGRFTNSYSHLLDARVNGGGGIGLTPIRTESVLFRASLTAQLEYARYASDTFNLDVAHDGATRLVPRVGVLSNGWYRVKETPVGFRYLGEVSIDPRDPRDNRQFLDAGLDLKIGATGWGARLSAMWTRDSVVPEGVRPAELKAGIGLGYTTPKPTP